MAPHSHIIGHVIGAGPADLKTGPAPIETFAEDRGNGYATKAAELLLQHLARDTRYTTAMLLIDLEKQATPTVAVRCGSNRQDDLRGQRDFTRPIT